VCLCLQQQSSCSFVLLLERLGFTVLQAIYIIPTVQTTTIPMNRIMGLSPPPAPPLSSPQQTVLPNVQFAMLAHLPRLLPLFRVYEAYSTNQIVQENLSSNLGWNYPWPSFAYLSAKRHNTKAPSPGNQS